MSEFKDMLKYFRKREGLSQSQLAKELGLSASTISMYEVGSREPDFITEEKIADFFNTDLNTLRGRDVEATLPQGSLHIVKRTLPVLGRIACGEPVAESEVTFDDVEEAPVNADYVLYAHGDSMIGARIFDGDLVYIKMQPTVENGEIAVVEIDGELTLKRFYYYAETMTITLMPENPAYKPLVYSGEAAKNVVVVGKAVAFRGTLV